jgi:hypothetical protein
VLNALKADPRTVDLRSLAGNFYEGAARCLELFEEEEIVDVLCEVCPPCPPWAIMGHHQTEEGVLWVGSPTLLNFYWWIDI